MEFLWKYAMPLLAGLDQPDGGTNGSWTKWYCEAWSRLSNAGLTKVTSPLDDTRIRLRIMALCWLAHDFNCAADGFDSSCPCWDEWIEHLEINPLWALLTTLDGGRLANYVAKADLFQSKSLEAEDDHYIFEKSEIAQDLNFRLVMAAAYQQRSVVVDALVKGFGDHSQFFAQLYACLFDFDELIWKRRDKIEEQIDELTEEMESESEDDRDSFQEEIDELRQQLNNDALARAVSDELMQSALNGALIFGDDDSARRMRGFQWCEEGCPVVVAGEPEIYGKLE